MKRGSALLAALALVLLSWNADAQGREIRRAKEPAAQDFGSVERTRLLEQGRVRRGSEAAQYGSVERRAMLAGTSVRFPKPLSERNHSLKTHRRR